MSLRRRGVTASVAVLSVAMAVLVGSGPASGVAATPLPWSSFSHVLADAHGHVYVTGGEGTDGVWVRNADGSALTTVTGQPGASDLALSADGSTLYVALHDAAAISAIDTTTLTETRRYAVTGCPEDVAVLGGAIWFDTSCDHQFGTLSKADLVTGTVQVVDDLSSQVALLPVPGDPTSLVVGERGILPSHVSRYTVAGATLTPAAIANVGGQTWWGGYLRSLAMDPDGQHVIIAAEGADHARMRLSDGVIDGYYTSGSGLNAPNSVSTTPALGGLVAAGVKGLLVPDVRVYRGGSLVRSIDFGPNDELLPDGLAWAPDGTRLYAVTAFHQLHVIDAPALADTSFTLTGPTSVAVGGQVALTVGLSAPAGPVTGATVTVSRTDASGTTMLTPVTTAVDGSATVHDTVGTTSATYSVSYAGDADHAAAAASIPVAVTKLASTLTFGAPTTATRGVAYSVSGVLKTGAAHAGARISLRRTDLAGTRTLSVTTNASGAFAYRDVPTVGGPVTWAAAWAGDATYAAATIARTVQVARAATSLSIRTSATTYAYGARATLTVRLGTTYNRRDVYVYARPLGTSVTAPGVLVAHLRVNSSGYAVATYVMRRRTTFTVRFAGDYRYAPAARAVSPYVRAKVALTLSGFYAKSGSTFLYAPTRYPVATISVAPGRPGGCWSLRVEQYVGGRWSTATTTTCARFPASSVAGAVLSTPRRRVPMRVRAWVPNDATSQTLGSASPWVYFRLG